jgi:iron(III) transport system substrate-binding protein
MLALGGPHAHSRGSIAALVGAALLLLACVPAAPSAPAPAGAPAASIAASPVSSEGQAEWDGVVQAACREGALQINVPSGTGPREGIAAFQEAYPCIRLEVTQLSSGDYEARVSAERSVGQYSFDVSIRGVSAAIFLRRIPDGWYAPIKPYLVWPDVLDDSKWLGGLNAAFQDAGATYVFGFNYYTQNSIYVNHDFIPEAGIARFADLVKPEFKGKIAAVDPTRTSSGTNQLSTVYRALGADVLRRLVKEQDLVGTADRRQAAEWLVRGRYPIGIGIASSELEPFEREGLTRGIKRLRDPELIGAGPGDGTLVVMDSAPHPNATKVFMNWFLSREGQTKFNSKALFNSRRLDVPPGEPETQVDPTKLDRYFNPSNEQNADVRQETIRLMQELMG